MVELTPALRGGDNQAKMLRILMVLEDYGELMFLQTVLKKIGFDVDAIQNPRSFTEAVLRMNPDVLVMTAYGKKVNGIELSQSVKRVRGMPHMVLIAAPGTMRPEDLNIATWLESPVGALDLLNAIADLAGLDKNILADKFSKLRLQETSSEARILKIDEDKPAEQMAKATESSGNFESFQETSLTSVERNERYQKFLREEPPGQIGFAVKQVQDQIKNLRREESAEDNADLERERKAFVEHLFRKKS